MRHPAPLPPELAHAGFTVAKAREAGLTLGRLRAADLASPFYGVRTLGGAESLHARAAALSVRFTQDQYFSHTTAAALLGLRMPEGFRPSELHVTSVRPHRAMRLSAVIGHQSGTKDTVLAHGMPVLNPIETWLQLAGSLDLDDVVVMGDGLVCRRGPLATIDSLRAATKTFRGHGRRSLFAALDLMRPGTDSARETLLRLLIVRAGFPEPEANGVIRNSHGAVIAHGDLVFRQWRTILEYEGRQHSDNSGQFATDIARLDELMDEDWRVIRVDKSLMARKAVLNGKISRALTRGGWNPNAI